MNPYTHLWILLGLTVIFSLIAVALGVQLKVPGFIGTRATLGAGLAVVLEIVGLIALWLGRSLARQKDIYKHQRVQTSVMLFDLVVIVFVMVATFSQDVIGPGVVPNDPVVPIEILHGISGVLLELLGLYIIVRMWFEKVLPKWFLFKNSRLLMLITLFWWTLQTIGGVGIFAMRYLAAPAVSFVTPTPTIVVASISTSAPNPSANTETGYPSAPLTLTGSPQVRGSVAARADRVYSDSLLVRLQDVPHPASGKEYLRWYIGTESEFRLSLGGWSVNRDGKIAAQYASPTGSNLS